MYLPVGPVGDKTQVRKRLLWAPDFAFHSATKIGDFLPMCKKFIIIKCFGKKDNLLGKQV
jgi:hypothetical protein